jgi:hypothetical protein
MNNWLKIALVASLPVLANAHTASPFLLPDTFDATSSNVSFQSAITIEKFFAPSMNFKTTYVVTNPDGKTVPINPATSLKRFSIAEFDLPSEGTYRIRTQDATGNSTKYALVDGRWLRVRPVRNPQNAPANPAPQKAPEQAKAPTATPAQPPRVIAADQVPEKAQIIEATNTFIAESFVTKGKPTAIPAVTNKGFEVKLISHPNELFSGESLKAQVLFNGKAVPDLEVDVFKGASTYEPNAKRELPHVVTNKKGEFEVKFDKAGIYLITASYPEANSDNTKKPNSENFTYGLTVEVAE